MFGLHLHLDHGLTDPDAFNKHIKFGILDIVSPTEMEKKEFYWMHKINSFQPVGINIKYPFGISINFFDIQYCFNNDGLLQTDL